MIFLVEHGSVGIAPVYDDQAQCVTVKGTTYRIFTWLQLEISVPLQLYFLDINH